MQPFSAVEFSVQRDPQFHQDVTCDDRVLGNSSQYSQVSLGDKRRSMSQKNRNLRKAMVGREGRCSKGNSLHEARRCGIMTCLKHTKSSLMEQGVGLGEVGCEPEDGAGWERHGEVLRAVISGCMPCSLSQGLRCSRCLASFPTSGAAGQEGLGQD